MKQTAQKSFMSLNAIHSLDLVRVNLSSEWQTLSSEVFPSDWVVLEWDCAEAVDIALDDFARLVGWTYSRPL